MHLLNGREERKVNGGRREGREGKETNKEGRREGRWKEGRKEEGRDFNALSMALPKEL